MEQKRLLLATSLSILVCGVWYLVVVPRLMPPKPRPVPNAQAENAAKPILPADGNAEDDVDPDAEAAPPAKAVGELNAAPGDGEAVAGEGDAEPRKPKKPELPSHPARVVELGSPDPANGFRQVVHLDSQGAAVNDIVMVDPKLVSLTPPHRPLVVVGADGLRPRTLELASPQLRANLRKLNWEVVDLQPAEAPHSSATFRLEVDGVQVSKKYSLTKVDPQAARPEADAYGLKLEIEFRNVSDTEKVVNYVLQGPTGLVLENEENTSKYRDVVAGFLTGPNQVNHQLMAATTIADGKTEEWKNPVQYIGVDAQYFAALILPQGNQLEKSYLDSIRQTLIGKRNADLPAASEISVELTSAPLTLAEAGSDEGADRVAHEYVLFAGPKRDEVLPPLTENIIDFGSFLGIGRGLISWTARKLMKLLVLFQSLTGSWGIAIVLLTIVVRGVMVPISIKQAQNAARMQELGPKMAALKEKYREDPTKQMKAMHELYRQHNVKPFQMGCLPALLQMPIFIGLYQSLNHAVDLRMAPFLYFDNLAAPDALAPLPFTVPVLGWKDLNLLPVIVYGLFMLQQKLFAPPPANEEQEIQMKTMNFMMIFMLVMFYRVPAGLCVYFIVSSLWGITEKLLLPKKNPAAGTAADPIVLPSETAPRRTAPQAESEAPEAGGLWSALLKAAEKPDAAARGARPKKRR